MLPISGRFRGLFCFLVHDGIVAQVRHMEDGLEIILNGETKNIEQLTVLGLLRELSLDPVRVAVELNLEIVAKPDYESTALNEGDRVEIVHFVGGG
jgi:sulfur carrier protein